MIDMDKIARIRQEIERQMKFYDEKEMKAWDDSEQGDEDALWYQGHRKMCAKLLTFLDTLSEEPDKSLEEAAEEKYPVYWKSYPKDGIVRSESSYDTNKQCRDAFIAGAEWQASQMPMPEDTVLFQKGVTEGRRLEREDMLKDAVEGEAVKIFEEGFASIHYNAFAIGEMAYFCKSDNIHLGQKVRIVVLKEEE